MPGLAQSWDPSADGKTVTLKLRTGVTFADGSAFDSADVKSSMDKIMDEKTAAVARTSLASVASVAAPDPQHRRAHHEERRRLAAANLASVNMAMLSSTDTDEKLATTPNGTGPYAFKARTPSQSLTLQKNAVLLGHQGDPRQRRVPGHPRRDVDRVGAAVRQRPDGRHRRPARRQDRRGRHAQGRQDAAAELPRAPAERPQGRPHRRQRAAGHPVRDRPQAGPRHRGPRRGRGHRPGDVTGIQVRPELAALPEPRPGQGQPTTSPRRASPR